MPPDMPAAAIAQAASQHQQLRVATLATLAASLKATPLPTPALVVIGRIVTMRDVLADMVASLD